MKISKEDLKQIIKEELLLVLEGVNPIPHPAPTGDENPEEVLNPDSMEEDVGDGRTVLDDIKRYVKRIEDSGHAVFEDEDGGIVIAREPEGAEVARIFDSGNKGRERYAVEWLPASGHKGTHLYDTIEHILSGQVRTTDGSETHIGQPTLQLEQ
jgi:hypothetical protein